MGRNAERGTSKYLAIRMKSKGLQKLKYFCQMCQKQCRDENGFKCHMMSESHNRQMQIISDNPHYYIEKFSKYNQLILREFKSGYLHALKTAHSSKVVSANKVYQEYISDRMHMHMNATKWETLTDFCNHLAENGLITIEGKDDRNGILIKYIDQNIDEISEREIKKQKKRHDLVDKESNIQMMNRHIEMANKKLEQAAENSDDQKKLKIHNEPLIDDRGTFKISLKQEELSEKSINSSKNKKSIFQSSEKTLKKKNNNKNSDNSLSIDVPLPWIQPGIVIKLIGESLGSEMIGSKFIIRKILSKNDYVALCAPIEDANQQSLFKIHENELETVIPALGSKVLILSGIYRGIIGKLLSISVENFCCSVQLMEGLHINKVVHKLDYENISKLFQ
ncbi:MAG: hypothetical protein MHPSP_001099 [Paramarteilia canceri]